MISFIEGTVDHAGPLSAVINCHGIGYRIEIPITTAEKLPRDGKPVRLHVHPVYREDSQALYGFATPEERDFFHLVTSKVSGIGPKIGLNLMSRLSFQMLREAIGRGDAALLAKCPGIGKKTAERLCIELKDKLGTGMAGAAGGSGAAAAPVSNGSAAAGPDNAVADAVQALVALGFKVDTADQAVRKASRSLGADAGTDALIKAALKTG